MSVTTELVVAGGTAIAGGALAPFLGKRAPHWRLLAIPGPKNGGYWAHQVAFKIQYRRFWGWRSKAAVDVATDSSITYKAKKKEAVDLLQSYIDNTFRPDTIVWDSQLDGWEMLEEYKKG